MELYEYIQLWGMETVMAMQRKIISTPNDRGYSKAGSRILTEFNPSFVADTNSVNWKVEFPGYGKWVDSGRGSGFMPPPEPIKEWMNHRGIVPTDERAFIWGTRKLIAARGVRGTDFFQVFDDRVENGLDKRIGEYIINRIEQKLVQIQNQIK